MATAHPIPRGLSRGPADRLAQLGPLTADLVLAGLFLWAGLTKAWDPQSLARTIDGYRVLPAALVTPTAHLLPWWEIAGGLVLLSRRCVVPARALLLGLLVLYAGVALAAWARGLSVGCGCFGGAGAGVSSGGGSGVSSGGTSGGGPGRVAIRDLLILAGLAILWAPRLERFRGRRGRDGP